MRAGEGGGGWTSDATSARTVQHVPARRVPSACGTPRVKTEPHCDARSVRTSPRCSVEALCAACMRRAEGRGGVWLHRFHTSPFGRISSPAVGSVRAQLAEKRWRMSGSEPGASETGGAACACSSRHSSSGSSGGMHATRLSVFAAATSRSGSDPATTRGRFRGRWRGLASQICCMAGPSLAVDAVLEGPRCAAAAASAAFDSLSSKMNVNGRCTRYCY